MLFVLAAAIAFAFAPGAEAATLTVDSLNDTDDSNLGNGVCADGSSNCTLRAAIEEANALAGQDSIDFSVTGVIDIGSELPISTAMTITGPGPEDLTVERPGSALADYRIFLVQNNMGQVFGATISGMEIAGGSSQGGSGVVVGGPTQLILRDVTETTPPVGSRRRAAGSSLDLSARST
jgi:CSLREA domain-containing protein